MEPVYKRILLKVSGEALLGKKEYGVDPKTCDYIADEIRSISQLGVKIGVVVGGGNIFRGLIASISGMDRVSADYMGMLATVINGLALQDSLEKMGLYTRLMTAVRMEALAEPYIRRRAIRHLEKGRIVIMAAGTGNPYFTTDTAAALRGIEIDADLIMKATRVNGIYSDDPEKNQQAVFFSTLSYLDVLNKGLKVMDATAISLCMENKLPIVVFNLHEKANAKRIVLGEKIGTLVTA